MTSSLSPHRGTYNAQSGVGTRTAARPSWTRTCRIVNAPVPTARCRAVLPLKSLASGGAPNSINTLTSAGRLSNTALCISFHLRAAYPITSKHIFMHYLTAMECDIGFSNEPGIGIQRATERGDAEVSLHGWNVHTSTGISKPGSDSCRKLRTRTIRMVHQVRHKLCTRSLSEENNNTTTRHRDCATTRTVFAAS